MFRVNTKRTWMQCIYTEMSNYLTGPIICRMMIPLLKSTAYVCYVFIAGVCMWHTNLVIRTFVLSNLRCSAIRRDSAGLFHVKFVSLLKTLAFPWTTANLTAFKKSRLSWYLVQCDDTQNENWIWRSRKWLLGSHQNPCGVTWLYFQIHLAQPRLWIDSSWPGIVFLLFLHSI